MSDLVVTLRITFTNRGYRGELSAEDHALDVAQTITDLYGAKVELLDE